jgi:putative serine protease PepD
MSETPAGTQNPAGPTEPDSAPGAVDGRAGHPEQPIFSYRPYQANHYDTTPYGTATPYGHLPPPASPGDTSCVEKRPRRRRLAALAAVAVVAAAVGGGVGGFVGHETASTSSSALGTLNQPMPTTGDLPASAITQVASKVLPSVVQLAGSAGEGSGVVLSADGLILTHAHVLAAAGNSGGLTATFQNGSTAPVQVIGKDARTDIAVVKAQNVAGLTPIQLGNSDGLAVGQQVVAVGSPLGLSGTVTSGIVSALNRPVVTQQEQPQQTPRGGFGGLSGLGSFGSLGGSGGGEPAAPPPSSALDAIQTDAAINPGNSGGPLVDMQGRIVGLNSAIASLDSAQSGGQSGSIGLGFSIPINQAKRIADQLIATGHAEQAQLGVNIKDGSPTGAQVAGVQAGSAAAKAGLQPGDLITKVNTQLIQDADALSAAINSQAPNTPVTLTVTSGAGAPRNVPVTLGSVTAS